MQSTKMTCGRSRNYGDACAMAHALELVGERWSLIVVRELMFGPRRFSELRQELPLISANTLTQRLEGLTSIGVVARRLLPSPANVHVYELTEWGLAIEPVLLELGRWAVRSPLHDPTLAFSGVSLALSLRAMFDAGSCGSRAMDVSLKIGRERYVATIRARRLRVTRSPEDSSRVEFAGTAEALARLIYAIEPADLIWQTGQVTMTGDRSMGEAFLSCFPDLGLKK